MARKFLLQSEIFGYVSSVDPTNLPEDGFLVTGSQNVLIDFQKKIKIRPGFTLLGAGNAALVPILKGWTWLTSTGLELGQRCYNGVLQAYLGTIDGVAINTWTTIAQGFSATEKIRPAAWYDATEGIDIQLMVNGDQNVYEINGAVAVVATASNAAGAIAQLSGTPTAAGSGYNVGDLVTITGDGGTGATAKVLAVTGGTGAGSVASLAIQAGGNGYRINDQIALIGETGTGAVIYVSSIGTQGVTSANVSNGGIGFLVGDVLTITGGGDNAQITVQGVDSEGGINFFSITNEGSGYLESGASVPCTGGTGTGCTLNITVADSDNGIVQGLNIVTGGSGYTTEPNITTSGGTGTGLEVTVNSDAIGGVTSLVLVANGSGYSTGTGAVTTGGTGTGLTVNIETVASGFITKQGTTTWAQNRFYTTRNLNLVNIRTGIVYPYTAGFASQTLVGCGDVSGIQAGDILVQQMVTHGNIVDVTSRTTNDTILVYQNQLYLGSFNDPTVYISKNTSFSDFSYSAPRNAGEGGLLTLDGVSAGLGVLTGFPMAFAGFSSIFKVQYVANVSTDSPLAEAIEVTKLKAGNGQGAISPDCIFPVGNSLAWVSNEPALRILTQPELIETTKLISYSNPIKPDFDAEDWANAEGIWNKNELFLFAPKTSHTYILEFFQDPITFKESQYWQPPQVIPIGSACTIGGILYGHSNVTPETYRVFDTTQGYSDTNSDGDKLPINAVAIMAYRNYKDREVLKNFDEFYVEGEISSQTDDLVMTLNYGWQGDVQTLNRTIDGTDKDILQGLVSNVSLGQASLATQPLAGSVNAPPDANRFSVDFEIAREDFDQLGVAFSTNNTDRFWSIIASGPNVAVSRRRNIPIRK